MTNENEQLDRIIEGILNIPIDKWKCEESGRFYHPPGTRRYSLALEKGFHVKLSGTSWRTNATQSMYAKEMSPMYGYSWKLSITKESKKIYEGSEDEARRIFKEIDGRRLVWENDQARLQKQAEFTSLESCLSATKSKLRENGETK